MTLKELIKSTQFRGCVTFQLVEEGVEYQASEGYGEHTERDFNGNIPEEMLPYAENRVGEIYPKSQIMPKAKPGKDGEYRVEQVDAIAIQVFAAPDENIVDFCNTGGNVYCGCCKVEDGWFMGGESSWGGVWKTYSQAWEAYLEKECGYVRDVNDAKELKKIWTHIYTEIIARMGDPNGCIRRLLDNLDKDLADNPDVR